MKKGLVITVAASPIPFRAGPRFIRENEPILIDWGTMVKDYQMNQECLSGERWRPLPWHQICT